MKLFCCPVCAGRGDLPFGFYMEDIQKSTFDYYPESQSITYESQKLATPQECKSCTGKGWIALEEDK